MGTNYYLMTGKCERCGRADEPLHIGKSSGGWCFALHVIPEKDINSLGDWKALFASEGATIKDEYGGAVSAREMIELISERSWKKREQELPRMVLDQNHAEYGPNNLLRSRVNSTHCIGHGEGTWDYIIGDFS